jgi:hypothetical protein
MSYISVSLETEYVNIIHSTSEEIIETGESAGERKKKKRIRKVNNTQLPAGAGLTQLLQWLGYGVLDDQNTIFSRVKSLFS